MAEQYISIQENASDGERVSTLAVDSKTGALRVMGNLPHGYRFAAKDHSDARALAAYFLTQWLGADDTRRVLDVADSLREVANK